MLVASTVLEHFFENIFLFAPHSGYAQWQVGGQNQDEVFLAAQEAAGQHRDAQGRFQIPFFIIRLRERFKCNIHRWKNSIAFALFGHYL